MPFNVEPTNVESLFTTDTMRRAWQTVRRHGEAAGIDKVTMGEFQRHLDGQLSRLRGEVLEGTYRPQKALRFYKTKASGKKRPLTVWAIRDRVLQRVVHDYLMGLLDPIFLDCSYGFRPGRNVSDAIARVQQVLHSGMTWLVDADIEDCFDSIPAELMLGQVRTIVHQPNIVHLVELWLHTPIVGEPGVLTGVCQGSVLSPLLTNLYLHRFDLVISALPMAQLVRFADDVRRR